MTTIKGEIKNKGKITGTLTPAKTMAAKLNNGIKRMVDGSVVTCATRYDLPTIGSTEYIYIVVGKSATYRWDEANMLYYCCGRDYEEIEIINGGGKN